MLQKLHHVAYRCNDAAETVKFYTEILGMRFVHAVTNDYVPSIKEFSPHLHIFFEMADKSCIAFFEVPVSPSAKKDPNTPEWVQHLALEVKDMDVLREGKRRLEAAGVAVVGPVDHHICQSIYFFDPNGHRLEMAVATEDFSDAEHEREAYAMLAAWEKRKHAENWPRKAA